MSTDPQLYKNRATTIHQTIYATIERKRAGGMNKAETFSPTKRAELSIIATAKLILFHKKIIEIRAIPASENIKMEIASKRSLFEFAD